MADELMEIALSRPRIRVNQLGYLAGGPKFGSLICDGLDRIAFEVRADGGGVAFRGETQPLGFDRSSGFTVHKVDFSDLVTTGCFHLHAGNDKSHPFLIDQLEYSTLYSDSLRFFYLQRSGIAIDDRIAPGFGRPAGHVGVSPNHGDVGVLAWSGPEAERLYPGWHCPGIFDVAGGWYDAGDHGKYMVSGGISAALLLATYERLIRRHKSIPPHLESAPSLLEEALWEVHWMLAMQVPAGRQYAGMAFHRVHDDYWTPFPLAPHQDPALRVLHRPSTAATVNLAAVAALGSRVIAKTDPEKARRFLTASIDAYESALQHPHVLAPDDNGAFGGGPYHDDNVEDEFYWAAVELFLTTRDVNYLDAIQDSPCHAQDVFDVDGFDCESVAAFARLQLATDPGSNRDQSWIQASVLTAADRLIALQSNQQWGQPYGSDEWDWGSNGRILNNLIVIATANDLSTHNRYLESLLTGVDYLFGRNALGLSFVTGHGVEFSHNQRVRHFAHSLDPSFPPPPAGSLAGGAASKHYPGFPGDPRFADLPPQLCYVDEATSETTNDVCIRWNAALVWISAYLADFQISR